MPRRLPISLPLLASLPLLFSLPACSGGGSDSTPAPPPTQQPTTAAIGAGPPGGLGAIPGGNQGPGRTPGPGGFAAGRPGGAQPAPGAAPAAAGGDLTTLFTGKPSAGIKPSETIHYAGGVFAGLPEGWSSADWNQDGYTDQCVYLFPKTNKERNEICLKTMSALPNQADLRREAYAARWDKAEFEAWVDGTAGYLSYPAKIAKGKGTSITKEGDREGYAVWVQVPGKKNVLVLGSWPLSNPAVKPLFLDIVKGLGTCTFKPQKGCVPDKPYDG